MDLDVVTVSDALVHTLRAELLAGDLPGGAELRDTDLSERFAVARPTVRAAVAELVAEGLLERRRGQSARVRSFTAADAIDIYRLRRAVELAAVREVVAARAPLDGVREVLATFAALPDDAAWGRAADADVAFHRAVFVATGSPRLLAAFDGLSTELRLLVAQLRPAYGGSSDLAAEHHQLFSVLAAGRVRPAEVAWRVHLDEAEEFLVATFKERSP
jgi:DNA-binding GntR family transcriptional regulator